MVIAGKWSVYYSAEASLNRRRKNNNVCFLDVELMEYGFFLVFLEKLALSVELLSKLKYTDHIENLNQFNKLRMYIGFILTTYRCNKL
jgi:hypothetical protein